MERWALNGKSVRIWKVVMSYLTVNVLASDTSVAHVRFKPGTSQMQV